MYLIMNHIVLRKFVIGYNIGNKVIQLNGSDGKSNIILSKGLDITLDLGKMDNTKLNNAKVN